MPSRGVFVGLCTLDVVHRVDDLPGANRKVTAISQFVSAGGPATNAAVTFAALGGSAVLVTSVGSGVLGEAIRADLAECGVTVVDVAADHEAAVSAVTLDASTGERSVVGIDGASADVAAPTDVDDVISTADVVMVDGHHPRLALWAATTARAAGVPVVVDAGRWRPVFAELLPWSDDVICSADFRMPGTSDAVASRTVLAGRGPQRVATSHGSGPIEWAVEHEAGEVDVPRVTAVDTLGAGDVLHGAYAYFRTHDLEFPDQLARAAQVAAIRCSVLGPRTWIPRVADMTMEGTA